MTIQHIWIRESLQQQGQDLDLTTGGSDVEEGVAIVRSGLVQKTRIRGHRSPHSGDVAALDGGEDPLVVRSHSTAHALPHLQLKDDDDDDVRLGNHDTVCNR